jgi:hypothetical protein
MNLNPNDIVTFKLTTGEEIIARVKSIESDHYLIDQPISAVLGPQGLQLMPSLFSAKMEQTVRLNTGSWIMVAETREDVRNSYIQATTGIAPVTKQIITG